MELVFEKEYLRELYETGKTSNKKYRLQKLTENYVVSNAKVKKAMGVDKMPVTAREGLMKTIRSFAQ